MKKKYHSLETKEKIRQSLLGHKLSSETKEKIRKTLKGNVPWNKGKTNIFSQETLNRMSMSRKDVPRGPMPLETKLKIGLAQKDNKSARWKGDDVGYSGVHIWVYKEKGKANRCEFADDTCSSFFEWSNISQLYRRNIDDWRQLCRSHHSRYDHFYRKHGYNLERVL